MPVDSADGRMEETSAWKGVADVQCLLILFDADISEILINFGILIKSGLTPIN